MKLISLLSYSVPRASDSLNKEVHFPREQGAGVSMDACKPASLISYDLFRRVVIPYFLCQQHLVNRYYLILHSLSTKHFRLLARNTFHNTNHPILLKEFWVLLLIIVREKKSGFSTQSELVFYVINLPSGADPGWMSSISNHQHLWLKSYHCRNSLFTLPHWVIFLTGTW